VGLMRRVESRMEDAVTPGPRSPSTREPKSAPQTKGSKLHVQPSELARKLVKEMEDHKVARNGVALVPNHYTIYLCPQDHVRLRDHQEETSAKLERHLAKHTRAKKYELREAIAVSMTVDPELKPGYFGILAEATGRAVVRMQEPIAPALVVEVSGSVAASQSTKIIAADEATRLDLANQRIIIRSGGRVSEFRKGRVIVGRARDVDFHIDDPNISRRHAAISWKDGKVLIEDLKSTNGTLVNGRPVSSTVLRPDDVVLIGDSRITVETG